MFKVSGQSLVGHALGAGRPDEAHDVVDHLYGWAWRAGVAAHGRDAPPGPVLPRLFSSDADVLHAATVALLCWP